MAIKVTSAADGGGTGEPANGSVGRVDRVGTAIPTGGTATGGAGPRVGVARPIGGWKHNTIRRL